MCGRSAQRVRAFRSDLLEDCSEDKEDDSVWAVTCFVVRAGYRGQGITYPSKRRCVMRIGF